MGENRFEVVLLDGTYELFRYFAVTPAAVVDGRDVAAARAVTRSILGLIEGGASHLGVATDHVIESFRNDLWPGYKTGAGIEPRLLAQFGLLEDVLRGLGIVVWPMVEFEADDALAAAAAMAAADRSVRRVLIATPDKDLAQCVRGDRVVMLNRRSGDIIDEPGVWEKWGVGPSSIPDWLALVGDSADGFPGLPGWGAKSAATLLARHGSIEAIPADPDEWDVGVRGRDRLAASLAGGRERAALFRRLATLRTDVPLGTSVADLRWNGPSDRIHQVATRLNAPDLVDRVVALTR